MNKRGGGVAPPNSLEYEQERGVGVAPPPNSLEYEQERGWGSSSPYYEKRQ